MPYNIYTRPYNRYNRPNNRYTRSYSRYSGPIHGVRVSLIFRCHERGGEA